MELEFRLNGRPVRIEADGNRRLLWLLRVDLGLTGTKYGCGSGYCGTCTVLLDGQPVRSCTLPVRGIAEADVVTIEGLGLDGELHPIQQAFVDHGALQCGFCTPGMILTAHALLAATPHPTREQIAAALEENLCRCGAHRRILRAVAAAAGTTGGER
jgi:aerobic-type carbon monoxide dehydrogenase small subunit (CoxS/CutS family)